MLILPRKEKETVIIGDLLTIEVRKIENKRVTLCFSTINKEIKKLQYAITDYFNPTLELDEYVPLGEEEEEINDVCLMKKNTSTFIKIITKKEGGSIYISSHIKIYISNITLESVDLGISAPKTVSVTRGEVTSKLKEAIFRFLISGPIKYQKESLT